MTFGNGLGSKRILLLALLTVAPALRATPTRAEDCSGGTFDSTFALIQKAVFENHGCTSQVCHGSPGAPGGGGLDLRPEVAHENLVDTDATTVSGWKRLVPGRREASLLFINLAAGTDPAGTRAPLRAMPVGYPPLTADELDAVRRWIEAGAPKEGVVPGTAELLDACLPPPEPLSIKPLAPPEPGAGVQLRMPRVELRPESEHEVCFAMHYDISEQVPAAFRSADGRSFRYKASEVRQDPQSHHLIVSTYTGDTAPGDAVWGPFRCRGGDRHGETCPPTDRAFCGSGLCAADPVSAAACIGYGPPDAQVGIANAGFVGAQEAGSASQLPPGVYAEAPLAGMLIFDSHAFNLTDKPGKIEAWMNFEFAPPEEQLVPLHVIFDTRTIFKMNVPAFATEEVCSIYELPRGAHLSQLSSHAHRWMKRWRTFEGAWTCRGGPRAGEACEPLGYDLVSSDVCRGFPCASEVRRRAGDCNRDGGVSVDELITGINVALGAADPSACAEADADGDGAVRVDEVMLGVRAALFGLPAAEPRDAMQSLLYVSLIYNDPLVLEFSPPLVMSSPDPAERSLTYCALFDNGFSNPDEVKTRAASPLPPLIGLGGPCRTATHCTAGRIGAPCQGKSDAERDASCDSSAGAGDGRCDACPVRGGMTTGDEMFILMGQYYVP